MTFGDYIDGPIGTRISNANSAVYGVTGGIDLTRNVSLVGNIGYTDSNVRVGLPIIGGVNIADSKVLYTAGCSCGYPKVQDSFHCRGRGGSYPLRGAHRSATTNATNFAGNSAGRRPSRALGVRAAVRTTSKFDYRARLAQEPGRTTWPHAGADVNPALSAREHLARAAHHITHMARPARDRARTAERRSSHSCVFLPSSLARSTARPQIRRRSGRSRLSSRARSLI
jgi:hypothetical protein